MDAFKRTQYGTGKIDKALSSLGLGFFYEAFTNKKDARQREEYLKTTKGRRTLRLMLQDTF